MHLTRDEESIYNGEQGPTLQKMMEILVALGDIYDAKKLIPVKSAQIAGVSYKTMGDAGLEWVEDLDGKAKIPAVLNPAGMDRMAFADMGIDATFRRQAGAVAEGLREAWHQARVHLHPVLSRQAPVRRSSRLVRIVGGLLSLTLCWAPAPTGRAARQLSLPRCSAKLLITVYISPRTVTRL